MSKRLGTYLGNRMWNGLMGDALSDYFSNYEKDLKDKWIEVWVSNTFYRDAPTGSLNSEVRKIMGQFKEFRINDYIDDTDCGKESVIDRDIVLKHYNYVKREFGRVEGESLYYIALNDIYYIKLLINQEPVGLVENRDRMSARTSYKPLAEAILSDDSASSPYVFVILITMPQQIL